MVDHLAACARRRAAHREIARQRADHAHETALGLVRAADVIVVEDLKIRNMVRRPANTDIVTASNITRARLVLRDAHAAQREAPRSCS